MPATSRWSSCGHLRQRRLPCATPGCSHTTEHDELQAVVITPSGFNKGWKYTDKNPPEEYLQKIKWVRVGCVPESGLSEGEEPIFMWSPTGDPTPSRKCFSSSLVAFCPRCSCYLGNYQFHRRGVEFYMGCPSCSVRLRPRYKKKAGVIEWYEVKGALLGSKPTVALLEYPE